MSRRSLLERPMPKNERHTLILKTRETREFAGVPRNKRESDERQFSVN